MRSRRIAVFSAMLLFARMARAQNTVADPLWVPGSSQKVCQPSGETDHETGLPTVSQTGTNYGLSGNDLGYSFQHHGKLWFLFGDTQPTATFNGKLNAQNDAPRTPSDNDAVGFTSGTDITQCLKLDFVRDSIGAFENPVVLNAQGKPAITLGIDEVPISGIDQGGRMLVIFGTDNNVLMPAPGNLGAPTRSVVAVSDDDGVSYHYLYDFSAPAQPRGEGAKFINVAIGSGTDGYLYFWGSQGGMGYRHSSVFLARKQTNSMAQSGGMQYFTGVSASGTPNFSASESDAVALFLDVNGSNSTPAPCTGELGVEFNQFVQRWVMLYNCLDSTPTNPGGVYMRFAPQPWGPWGAPQTIFNGMRDRGDCHFIHRAVTSTQPACDSVGDPGHEDVQGGAYGPYFISPFTTGNAADGTSTFYYMLSTWNPYIEVIMKTTIQVSSATPVIGLVANAEGENGTIAPNTWLEIKGLNLAPAGDTRMWKDSDLVNNQLPKQLDGVSVTVNGKPAYVYYISPTQVNTLTPPDAIAGPVQVQVTNNGVISSAYTAQAQLIAPSFFVFGGGPNVAAVHASGNGYLIGPVNLYPGSTTPAKPGETIMLYANGFGPTSTPVVSRSAMQGGTLSPLPVVQIGGLNAPVTFAGLVYPGQFQFNVIVPPTAPDGNNTLTATYNGLTTQSNVVLAVQH